VLPDPGAVLHSIHRFHSCLRRRRARRIHRPPPRTPTCSCAAPTLAKLPRMTYFYTALCLYLACLTALLGWWARFPR
jgi:hypothetical protein